MKIFPLGFQNIAFKSFKMLLNQRITFYYPAILILSAGYTFLLPQQSPLYQSYARFNNLLSRLFAYHSSRFLSDECKFLSWKIIFFDANRRKFFHIVWTWFRLDEPLKFQLSYSSQGIINLMKLLAILVVICQTHY